MADTSNPEWVYIDDYLGEQALDFIEHEDGWPSMGLRFSPEANTTAYLNVLLEAAEKNREKFDVYTHETMPKRYHYSHTPRIAPIYVIPKYGYALTTRVRGDPGMTKGVGPFLSLPKIGLSAELLPPRITGMTTETIACKQSSSPTVHSQTSSNLCITSLGCQTRTRVGTRLRMTFTLWIHSRTWKSTAW